MASRTWPPGWVNWQRYDIIAKSENPIGDPRKLLDQQRQTLQKLLAGRFQLRVRRETRERPAYVLAVDKNGPKMKENNDLKSAPFPVIRMTERGQATAQVVSMSYMVQFLASQLGRIVLDRTEMKGAYDFTWNGLRIRLSDRAAGRFPTRLRRTRMAPRSSQPFSGSSGSNWNRRKGRWNSSS